MITGLFALKYLPTGELFPETLGRYTSFNPGECPPNSLPPRMFTTKGGAGRARAAWLAGLWIAPLETESEGWEYRSYTYRDLPRPDHLPKDYVERKPEDVVVVPVTLLECALPAVSKG